MAEKSAPNDRSAPDRSAYDSLTPKHRKFVDAYVGRARFNASKAYRLAGYKPHDGNASRLRGNERVSAAIEEKLDALNMPDKVAAAILSDQAAATADDFLVFERRQQQEDVWVPIGIAIEEKRLEVEVERETQARLDLDKDKAADKALAKLEQELVRLEVMQEKDPGRLVKIPGPVREVVIERIDLKKMKRAGKLHLIKSVKHDKNGRVSVELYSAHDAAHKIRQAHGAYGAKGTEDDPVHLAVKGLDFTHPSEEEVSGGTD